MKITDQVKLLNTAFRKTDDSTLYKGFAVPKLGEWTRKDGYKKITSLSKDGECLACPIIAMVETKMREDNVTLQITGRQAEYKETRTVTQIDSTTIDRKIYQPSSTEVTTSLLVPRYTRPYAIFLLSGLGNKIYEVSSVTSDVLVPDDGGRVSFYALASEGSKVIYHVGMYKVREYLMEVLNAIWSSPTTCPRCNGTGIINGTTTCPQCNGYKYDGYNATKGVQIKKGYDVGLTRKKFTYPTSASENAIVKDFVNKVWTQKWWVTPTISEIKRMFSHFYGVEPESVIIDEVFHPQMPQWNISLPKEASLKSPFSSIDLDLMRYIAESVTPVGVNVFVSFYEIMSFGNMDDFDGTIYQALYEESSMEHLYHLWGLRYDLANGWQSAVDDFESTGISACWTTSGAAILNANDRFRHVLRLSGSGAYAQRNLTVGTGCGCGGVTGGSFELWMHPVSSNLRISLRDCSGVEGFYCEYDQDVTGLVWHSDLVARNKLHSMMPDNELHLRIEVIGTNANFYVNRELSASGSYVPGAASGAIMRIENQTSGVGYVDAIGWEWASGYVLGDNWQDLHKWGWGINHDDYVNGISGLYQDYFRWDKPILW